LIGWGGQIRLSGLVETIYFHLPLG